METVVYGRNVEVPDHFRVLVADKLTRLERYDHKIIRIDVELYHEPNPRQSKSCQRVQITGRGRGPVARGEACAGDFYSALDRAAAKLEARLRRAHDRRRVHHGRHTPPSVAHVTGGAPAVTPHLPSADGRGPELAAATLVATDTRADDAPAVSSPDVSPDVSPEVDAGAKLAGAESARTGSARTGSARTGSARTGSARTGSARTGSAVPEPREDDDTPGQIVRRKRHPAEPMSVDDALSEMELVGHDFYLFADSETGLPSVVYRRRGYAYGVIVLG